MDAATDLLLDIPYSAYKQQLLHVPFANYGLYSGLTSKQRGPQSPPQPYAQSVPITSFALDPWKCNTQFLFTLALSRKMERICCLMLDRAYIPDVNSPILGYPLLSKAEKPTKEAKERRKSNKSAADEMEASKASYKEQKSQLVPSYFMLAVALGLRGLVKFMIKVMMIDFFLIIAYLILAGCQCQSNLEWIDCVACGRVQ